MNDKPHKNKKFSEIILNNRIIIIFILFIIDWSISAWDWITANQFLNSIDIVYYFLVLNYITLVSYLYGKIFNFIELIKKIRRVAYTEKKGHSANFDFSYAIFIWIVIRIIQFTEFNIQTYLVVFLTTIIFSLLLDIVFILITYTKDKGITIIKMMIIFITNILIFYPFEFYNVELWRFILIIIYISGFTIFILILFYFRVTIKSKRGRSFRLWRLVRP